MIEVFIDKTVICSSARKKFIVQVPIPTIQEINKQDEFFAEKTIKEEFEKMWNDN